jgi:hypothetical protein
MSEPKKEQTSEYACSEIKIVVGGQEWCVWKTGYPDAMIPFQAMPTMNVQVGNIGGPVTIIIGDPPPPTTTTK